MTVAQTFVKKSREKGVLQFVYLFLVLCACSFMPEETGRMLSKFLTITNGSINIEDSFLTGTSVIIFFEICFGIISVIIVSKIFTSHYVFMAIAGYLSIIANTVPTLMNNVFFLTFTAGFVLNYIQFIRQERLNLMNQKEEADI